MTGAMLLVSSEQKHSQVLWQVLDECANEHAGMQAEERPVIGVRGQRKDLARVAKLIQARPAPN